MPIKTKIFAEQLPKETQTRFKDLIQDGFIVGQFDYLALDGNKPSYANFLVEDGGFLKKIEISLLKLISFTHLQHRWHCLVTEGNDFKYCEIAFQFVTY